MRGRFGLFLLLLAPALFAAESRKSPTRPGDTTTAYKGAIVTDAETGKVLFEDRADTVTPPASMTKLMTFAIVHDRIAAGALSLSTPVKVTVPDSKIGGTQVYLDPRETFSVEELIYAMMIQSANDAAHALARTAAGSAEAFVALMNAKAAQLGMKQTTFRTPHGLPPATRKVADGDVTTPRDFALLCRHLVQQTDVLKYTAVAKRDFAPQRAKGPMHMDNHNKLLGKVAGVDGLKTGFTDAAGYCLSATALRDGRRVIVVIMGALGANGQRDFGRARDIRAVELLERGFAALPPAAARPASVSSPAPAPASPARATPSPAPVPAANPPAAESPLKPAPRPAAAPADEQPLKLTIPKR
ncbi:MAG: D-alanyl-D-alanine carboxypeptidase [Opitutaceae bacterium]|nr:D-alanyl-D-alanine carboxypeptidase [Opitutaceae bacterium]